MQLVDMETKAPANIGDRVRTFRDESGTLMRMERPHKPGSTGRVYVRMDGDTSEREFFPSVVNLEWIEREDRTE